MNRIDASLPTPDLCDVAFKEWAGVCDALAAGEQALILRKGGIAEDRGEFVPDHRWFWLYPTYLHEAEQGLKKAQASSQTGTVHPSTVTITAFASVETVGFLAHESTLDALDEFHVWKHETVVKRFHYRKPGLWVLGVRIYRRPEPAEIAVTPEQLGCKTWVPLESSLSTQGIVPVLGNQEFSERMSRIQSILTADR